MWHFPSTRIPLSEGVWAAVLKWRPGREPLDESIFQPKWDYANSQLMQQIITIVLWYIAEGC